ncbi:hypothetical protein [Streptomyces sp. VNUA24]|uniref:hypothetical protein n=1 Tax=Streptomyces sp. VNUA24 TaxID=3031131 RepID=UPI0023B79ACE|nr:hypothetical protein [Streptomyces sp. VNUA24]WEH13837.1 hypothetical protein PYR72_09025 [Streptomyces sp. VNUA24]
MTESVPGPATVTAADAVRARTETALNVPAPLVALWNVTNGLMTDTGVTVYSAECIGERNTTYEVARYAPGFVLIGDDSGGRGFLLRHDVPDSAVFSSDLGDLDPADFAVESSDFTSWIGSLRSLFR